VNAAQFNNVAPVGTNVQVLLDDGQTLHTLTRSVAWEIGYGNAHVKVEGITGGYSLNRVRVLVK